ncbi:CPBP family intramembrane metalloprotease [bacterium]|nr:CPBP family intramembrane metalloprotease [bacterium]
MDRKIAIKKVIWFLAINFVLTYGLGLIIYFQGGLASSPLRVIIMFIPMLSALFVQKVIAKEPIFKGGRLGIRIGKPMYLLLAPLITLVILVIIYAVTVLLNPGLLVTKEMLIENISKANIPLGNMSLFWAIMLIFALNIIVAPIINLPIILGEEIGWRGFLYPNLIAIFKKSGLIIGGIIWGLWHLPMILMGLNYPSNPFLGIFFMMVFCISWGIILQYIYQKSKSILSVGLAHGVMNWTATTVMIFLVVKDKMNMFLEGPTGIIGLSIVTLVAVYCYSKYRLIKK